MLGSCNRVNSMLQYLTPHCLLSAPSNKHRATSDSQHAISHRLYIHAKAIKLLGCENVSELNDHCIPKFYHLHKLCISCCSLVASLLSTMTRSIKDGSLDAATSHYKQSVSVATATMYCRLVIQKEMLLSTQIAHH